MSTPEEQQAMGNESAAQGAMNDTATAEEINAQNQLRYNAQMNDNMNVEPYHDKENFVDGDDSEGFFSFKIIMIIIAILFLLLAIYYFFFRKSEGGFENEIEEGEYE